MRNKAVCVLSISFGQNVKLTTKRETSAQGFHTVLPSPVSGAGLPPFFFSLNNNYESLVHVHVCACSDHCNFDIASVLIPHTTILPVN